MGNIVDRSKSVTVPPNQLLFAEEYRREWSNLVPKFKQTVCYSRTPCTPDGCILYLYVGHWIWWQVLLTQIGASHNPAVSWLAKEHLGKIISTHQFAMTHTQAKMHLFSMLYTRGAFPKTILANLATLVTMPLPIANQLSCQQFWELHPRAEIWLTYPRASLTANLLDRSCIV